VAAVTVPDEVLLDFDTSRLANWDAARAAQLLEEQPELYRNHLVAARWISGYGDRIEEDEEDEPAEQRNGYVAALRDLAAHLRQGDLVPGGVLYDDELSRLPGDAGGDPSV
jgi:hypothetical protein